MASIDKGLARLRGARPEDANAEIADLHRYGISAPIAFDQLTRVTLNPHALRKNRIINDAQVPASSAYKMLRTRVLQRMRRNGWVSLAVTGTCPAEGKTLTAINLAFSMACDLSSSVVLVDLDLRKPSIARYLGLSPRYGIADFLQGTVELERALLSPGLDRLALLLNERSFPNSSELLTSPQVEALVQHLKLGDGRIVIFDLPPLLVTDDMLAFSPLVDTSLLVVSEGTTRQADLIAAKELLQEANIVGTVLNRSSETIAPYYYYYGYGKP